MLIVFEGGEGSGKTTQLGRSHAWLCDEMCDEKSGDHPWHQQFSGQRLSVLKTREPGGTELGRHIRELLLHPDMVEPTQDRAELLLFAADRAQHVEGVLWPALRRGSLVLCDRFTDSTVAYQGYGRGLDLRLIQQLNQIATGGLEPDLTLWLDVAVETGLGRAQRRGSADRMEQNQIEFHQRVRQGFCELAAAYPQRIRRVDADRSADDVFQDVQQILQEAIAQWYSP
ncbi:MAG: dTMP kinase [Cyanobacteria bacterium J069]|nr:MAG: dTMP kinase [Cyanobacteria bacterium J069]